MSVNPGGEMIGANRMAESAAKQRYQTVNPLRYLFFAVYNLFANYPHLAGLVLL